MLAVGGTGGSLAGPTAGAEERAVAIADLGPIVEQVSGSLSSSIGASFEEKIAGVERAAGGALTQIQDAAGGLMGRIEAAYGDGRAALSATFGQSRAEVEVSAASATSEVTQSAEAGRQQAETGKETSLGQVDEALGQAESRVQSEVQSVRAGVQPEAGQSAVEEQAAAVASSYEGRDGAEEARAAEEEVAGRSTAEYATQSNSMAAELDGVSAQATQLWQTEGETARRHVEDAAQAAATVIDQGRSQTEEEITVQVDEQLGELSAGETEIQAQLETSRAGIAIEAETNVAAALETAQGDVQTQRQGLEEGRDEATAAADEAKSEFAALVQKYPGATADPEAVRAYLEGSADTQIRGLDGHLASYQAESDAAWLQGAESFAGQVGTAGDEVAASVAAGKEATTSTLGGMVAEADKALAGVAAGAGQQLAGIGEQATTAMASVSQQMQGGLEQGLADVADLLGQGQASVQSSSATAVGESRSAMVQAAEQATMSALDPRKLVGDLMSFIGPLWSSVAPFFEAIGNQFNWTLKQVANFYWGFIAGEAWFKDVGGADLVAFIGDLIAGFLYWGDIRDILKNFGTFFIDLLSGKGVRWLALILGIVAIIALVPGFGDALKVIVKGLVKLFLKEAAQKLAKEIAERLLKVFSQAEIDRLVKELGEDLVTELVEKLGEKALKELVENFGETGVKQLVKEFSVDGLQALIKTFDVAGLKDLVDSFTLKGLKDLVVAFPLDSLKALVDTYLIKGLKELVDKIGLQSLKDIVETFSLTGLKELVVAFPLPALKDLVEKILIKDLKSLVDKIDTQGLKKLVDGLGTDALKKLIQDLGTDVIARLFRGMVATTWHTVSLIDSIPRVGGIDAFIALVRRDGADAMIKYGADALQKVGKADLDTFAGIFATAISPEKLKKKWKHAVNFGIPGTFKDKDLAAHQQFRDALNKVVANADTVYVGPYSDFPHAAHFFQGDLIVIVELAGDFISGWGNAGNKLAGIRVTAPPKVGAKNFRVR